VVEMRKWLSGSVRGNWTLKLTALALAFLLWSVVKAEAPTRVTIPEVPVRVVLRDADWVLATPPAPATVSVVFSGPVRELVRLAVQRPELVLTVDQVREPSEIHVLRTAWVTMQAGMDNTRADDVLPSTVRVEFDRIMARMVPLSVTLVGSLPEGLELSAPIRLDPPAVSASGASRRLAQIDSLRLPAFDLGAVRGHDTLAIAIDTTGLGVQISPRTVRIIVPARPAEAEGQSSGAAVPRPPEPRRRGS
jgi:YbbR domain-containing protein